VTGDRDFVRLERPHPGVALVVLDRPERMNAMAFDVMVPLHEVLKEAHHDNDVRVVVITGAGHGFCSGADLESAGRPPYIDGLTLSSIAHRAADRLHDVMIAIHDMHQPVIAAVNGAAVGGGMCLAMGCDIRIASTAAYFRAAGINNGLTAAELGLSFTLPRAVGSSRTFDIMLTGRDVHAEEAERIGLVSEVVEPYRLLPRCYEMADRIAALSRPGIELTKKMIWSGLAAASYHDQMQHEMNAQLYVKMTTRNFEEAIRARREGRAPVFED
jgi:enoyl-CoA hydratase